MVLNLRVYRYRTHAEDRGAFVEEVTSDNHSFMLSDNAEESGMRDQLRREVRCRLHRREIGGEPVAVGDRGECPVTDTPAVRPIGGYRTPDRYFHRSLRVDR
jgi:hypothetical protein